MSVENYEFELCLRSPLRYRKWKVKDKKKFVESLTSEDEYMIKNATYDLVYDCLEDESTILTPEEFQYVLYRIRSSSLGGKFDYQFDCESCEKEFDFTLDIESDITLKFNEYSMIETENSNILMGEVQNKELYKEMVFDEKNILKKFYNDFLLHVVEINGNRYFSIDDVNEYIGELELNEEEEIFNKWKDMKSELNLEVPVKCPHCGNEENYIFDEIPDLIPNSWFLNV